MQLKLIPFLLGVITFTVSAIPLQVQAQEANQPINSTSDSSAFSNLNPSQQAIISKLNLSSAQKAQIQKLKQPVSSQQIESILTLGQRRQWLQMRHSLGSGK
jgi:Spy/CpxP family protein refolding chaperone